MYFVYVLKSLKNSQHYIGITKNMEKRIVEHNSGLSRYTKTRGPWELIHIEKKATLREAARREKFFKSGDGRKALKIILEKSRS